MGEGELVETGVRSAKHLVMDRLTPGGDESPEPGTGAVVRDGGEMVALYRDESGMLSRHSAVCTHMGCVVSWNDAERSWDCGCHGSRFATSGEVIQGPAIKPLKRLGHATAEPDAE